MKRFQSILICFLMLFSLAVPANAAETKTTLFHSETLMENGILVIDELVAYPQTRSSTQSYERSKTFKSGDTTIAIIAISGTFRYDGNTVSVVSKTVSRTDTYDGWNYSQNSFTSSGGTITLKGKLTKTLVPSISFTMTLSCDKDGNISYT